MTLHMTVIFQVRGGKRGNETVVLRPVRYAEKVQGLGATYATRLCLGYARYGAWTVGVLGLPDMSIQHYYVWGQGWGHFLTLCNTLPFALYNILPL